jgi:WD40 repeat protein
MARIRLPTVIALIALPLVAGAQTGGNLRWLKGGHAGKVAAVTCSPDGTMIASASDDATIKLWSTNGDLLRTFTTHPYPTTALAWSPDGAKLAAAAYAGGFWLSNNCIGRIFLWQATNGWLTTNVALARILTNHLGKVTSLAFSTDGTRLVSSGIEGSNIVRQVGTWTLLAQKAGYNTSVGPSPINALACSTNGLVASGCEDGTIRVWNSSWTQVWSTNCAPSNVTAIAFSPNGGLLATGSRDNTLRLWSTTNWSGIATLAGHTNEITTIAFSPNGATLASGSLDRTIRLWNVASRTCFASAIGHADAITAVAFSPDGARLISGSRDQSVRTWSAADGSFVQDFANHSDYVKAIALSPDGTLCASASDDASIQIRRLSDGVLTRVLTGHTGCVSAISFAPDSAVLVSAGGPLDPTLKLWRLDDGALLRTIAANTNGVMALALSADGTLLACGGDFDEKTIQLWNVNDGSLLRILEGHSNGVTALAFSPLGDQLASGGRKFDSTIKVWSATNGSLLQTFAGHANPIETVVFSPDGSAVASGSSGTNPLRIWELSDGSSRSFGADTNPVFFAAFSPDGNTLASAGRDAVNLWNVASGSLTQVVTGETFRISCLAYSPNGNLFAYGREDATVALATNSLGALGQPPLQFTGISRDTGGGSLLRAAVQSRARYIVQSSTDLENWVYLTLASSGTNTLQLKDPAIVADGPRFYRAVTPP